MCDSINQSINQTRQFSFFTRHLAIINTACAIVRKAGQRLFFSGGRSQSCLYALILYQYCNIVLSDYTYAGQNILASFSPAIPMRLLHVVAESAVHMIECCCANSRLAYDSAIIYIFRRTCFSHNSLKISRKERYT